MKEFMLVISMWANTTYYLEGEFNEGWEYIGNQMILEMPMTKTECEKMADDKRWTRHSKNPYYAMIVQCYPKDCQGKDVC
tara:strand:+ start:236 stop:475 length:240 start_codon:yes stop_codon:yes gene_type:complete